MMGGGMNPWHVNGPIHGSFTISFREAVVQPTTQPRQAFERTAGPIPKSPHVLIIHVRTLYLVDHTDSFSRLAVTNPICFFFSHSLANDLMI